MALPGQQLLNDIANGKTLLNNATIPGTKIKATDGWYVAVGCIGAILLAATPVAPIVLAVMTIAVLFQLENLLQGT